MKKIYGFSTCSIWEKHYLKIVEFKVIKETPKQYKINDTCWLTTINKSTMAVGDYEFYETKEQAIEGLINYCNRAIQYAENAIENNKKRKELLEKTKKEILENERY